MGNTAASDAKRLEAAIGRDKALALRLEGKPLRVVAETLGINKSNASRRIDRAIAAVCKENAETMRGLETLRLDKALEGIWARVVMGEYDAIDRLIKLSARRCKMFGLDAQEKPAPGVVTGLDAALALVAAEASKEDSAAFVMKLQALLDAMKAAAPPEPPLTP